MINIKISKEAIEQIENKKEDSIFRKEICEHLQEIINCSQVGSISSAGIEDYLSEISRTIKETRENHAKNWNN